MVVKRRNLESFRIHFSPERLEADSTGLCKGDGIELFQQTLESARLCLKDLLCQSLSLLLHSDTQYFAIMRGSTLQLRFLY
jgi:hypothetical protein